MKQPIIISHRGNPNGPDRINENTVESIIKAVERGFSVEFDLRYYFGSFWLGHDAPQYEISKPDLNNLLNKGLFFVHCKDIVTLQHFIENFYKPNNVIPFFHDVDECVLLDLICIWVHPNSIQNIDESLARKCIAVLPNRKTVHLQDGIDLSGWHGICTDYPEEVRNNL